MNPAAVVLLAFSLSMDSFAAALGKGAMSGRLPLYNLILIASLFGACEATALAAGWLAGQAFSTLITTVDHWIAFVLLLVVGGRMIRQGMRSDGVSVPSETGFSLRLVATAIATSIDAAAVGISLAFMAADLLLSVSIVGAVTFLVTLGGAGIGCRAAPVLGRRVEVLGGIGLISIGTAILIQHLYF